MTRLPYPKLVGMGSRLIDAAGRAESRAGHNATHLFDTPWFAWVVRSQTGVIDDALDETIGDVRYGVPVP